MPLYEYQCQKCGHRFERIQRFSDAMVKKCPDCGGKVEQLISAPAVQFKGSGWYVTDYAGKSSGRSVSNSDSDGKGEAGKDAGPKESDSKKDSKPKAESAAKSANKTRCGAAACSLTIQHFVDIINAAVVLRLPA